MPPTRRKTPATTANSRNQKQLSFGPQNSGNRITKPSAATQSKKEKSLEGRKASAAYEKPSVASIPATPSPGPEDPVSDPAPPSPIKRSPRTQKNERQQLQTTTSSSSARPIAIRKQTGPPAIPPSSTVGRKQQTSSSTAIATVPTTGNLKSDAALRVNDAQIRKYWRTKEDARIAPRVHQQGLNVNEKVLREFDACSQFGVCLVISSTPPRLFPLPLSTI